MDFHFSEDQEVVRTLARDFAEGCLAPRLEEIEREGRLPEDLFRQAGEMGLLGVELPEAWGGSGLGSDCAFLVMEEIAKVSAPVALAFSTHLSVLGAILRSGTPEQKALYLARGAAGEFAASMAFTEAETGSDPKQLTTTARRAGEGYVLSGTKRFITNASYPGPILLFAREEDGRCTAFLFEKQGEGWSLSTPWEKIGYHASPVYDVFLDGVQVGPEAVVGAPGEGFDLLLKASVHGKLSHVAISLGLIEACHDLALRYALEKKHRGASILKFQAVQLKIAHLGAQRESARWYAYHIAAVYDELEDPAERQAQVSLAKAFLCDLAPSYAQLAMSALGPYGVMAEYRVERYLRDAMVEPIIEVVSDVQRIIYASHVLRKGGL